MINPIQLQIELLINKAKKSLPEITPEQQKIYDFISEDIEKGLE